MDITILLIIFILICLIGLSWFAGTDAPYVPTKNIRIKKLLKEISLKKGQVFYELGSGDGRVVLEAARFGATAFGIEQSLIRVLYSRWQAKKFNLKNVKFIHGNIFENDFSKANVVFIFLLPDGIKKLEPLLKKNLKRGSLVITQTFHFQDWKPLKKVLIKNKNIPNTPLGKNVVEGDFWIYKIT